MSSAHTPPTTAHCAHSVLRSRSSPSGSVRSTCHMYPMRAGPTSNVIRWLPTDTAAR